MFGICGMNKIPSPKGEGAQRADEVKKDREGFAPLLWRGVGGEVKR